MFTQAKTSFAAISVPFYNPCSFTSHGLANFRSSRPFTSLSSPHRNYLLPQGAVQHADTEDSTKPAKSKRQTVAELRKIIAELQAENAELRAVLHPQEEAIAVVAAPTPKRKPKSMTFTDTTDLVNGINWPQPGGGESPPFYERPARDSPFPVPGDDNDAANTTNGVPPTKSPTKPLHIVHITAEMAPCAKVGGLGDVVTGLSKSCQDAGHHPEVILPYYECLPDSAVENLVFERAFDCPKGRVQDGVLQVSSLRTLAFTGTIEGVPVVLLRPDWDANNSPLFRGTRIYGGSYNEAEAYLYFCRAALEFVVQSGRRPDIIHAHEWQASAVPMLFWDFFSKALPEARPALTIHNMDNSGELRQDEFAATGVSGELYADINRALDERTIGHNPERLCLMKGGIVYSSFVTTVSPTYATETLTGGAAGWLRSTLARPEVSSKYFGVLNGIDTEMWNPATDALLPACYSSLYPEGKALCKRYLQQGLGLEVNPDKPLVAVISRLVPQKGIHLIEHSVGRTVSQGGQFVLLGSGHADGGLKRMAEEQFSDNRDVHMMFGYSEALAHLIYGAADIFLVPSMFEPCGLTQMIALRYGAVPVVRSTGGLADTVRDVDNSGSGGNGNGSGGGGAFALAPNGFVFDGIDAGSLESALDRALSMFSSRREEFAALQSRNLSEGERWSWTAPAQSYIELYSGALDH